MARKKNKTKANSKYMHQMNPKISKDLKSWAMMQGPEHGWNDEELQLLGELFETMSVIHDDLDDEFEAIYETIKVCAKRLCVGYTKVADTKIKRAKEGWLFDEVVNRTIVKILESELYNPSQTDSKKSAWVRMVTKNVFRDILRSLKSKREVSESTLRSGVDGAETGFSVAESGELFPYYLKKVKPRKKAG